MPHLANSSGHPNFSTPVQLRNNTLSTNFKTSPTKGREVILAPDFMVIGILGVGDVAIPFDDDLASLAVLT